MADPVADAYAQLLTDEFLERASESPNELQLTAANASCIGGGVVRDLGTARLAEAGYDPETGTRPDGGLMLTMDEDERALVVDRIDACVDLVGLLTDSFVSVGIDPDLALCVAQTYYDSGLMLEALAGMEYDEELNNRVDNALEAAAESCEA